MTRRGGSAFCFLARSESLWGHGPSRCRMHQADMSCLGIHRHSHAVKGIIQEFLHRCKGQSCTIQVTGGGYGNVRAFWLDISKGISACNVHLRGGGGTSKSPRQCSLAPDVPRPSGRAAALNSTLYLGFGCESCATCPVVPCSWPFGFLGTVVSSSHGKRARSSTPAQRCTLWLWLK